MEDEASVEVGFFEQEREPVAIVFPHLIVGNRFDSGPERHCLVGFGGCADVIIRAEDMTEDVGRVGHREPELADLARVERGDEQLLLGFADDALKRRFTGVDLATGAIDFSRAEAAFFFDQQDAAVLYDKHQRGVDAALPLGPIDG